MIDNHDHRGHRHHHHHLTCITEQMFRQHSQFQPPNQITATILEFILYVSFTTATVLLQVPHEYINGTPIPTVAFRGLPSIFYAFIICIIVAFSCAFSALMLASIIPNFARLTGFCSMASMSSAVVLLIWAIYWTN
ncbi:hypothetical protein C1H46_028379 [Malus baccata]|uniref:PGG domain-containing protein n=1 Tax=Malus baccata TaxID=106549 RepID=A0A540LHX2_MALBA|nr:hypothetical protein C1H46_028379 [Malus baccata]